MMKQLLAALKSPPPRTSAAEIDASLRQAQTEVEEADRLLQSARANYELSLLDENPKATQAARDKVTAGEILADRSRALLQLAEQRLAEAKEREAEEARLARYYEAQELAKRAKPVLQKYPLLARQIISILRDVAEAELAVSAANADLPRDKEPIVGPEQAVRGLPALPERILEERIEEPEWYYAEGAWKDTRVDSSLYGQIKPDGFGSIHGVLDTRHDTNHPDFGNPEYGAHRVVKRRERITDRYLPQGALIPTPIATGLRLPAFLPGQDALWAGVSRPDHIEGGLPEVSKQVLAEVARSEVAAKQRPRDTREDMMTIATKIEILDPVDAVEIAAFAQT